MEEEITMYYMVQGFFFIFEEMIGWQQKVLWWSHIPIFIYILSRK
jgi:hypothetical protein